MWSKICLSGMGKSMSTQQWMGTWQWVMGKGSTTNLVSTIIAMATFYKKEQRHGPNGLRHLWVTVSLRSSNIEGQSCCTRHTLFSTRETSSVRFSSVCWGGMAKTTQPQLCMDEWTRTWKTHVSRDGLTNYETRRWTTRNRFQLLEE